MSIEGDTASLTNLLDTVGCYKHFVHELISSRGPTAFHGGIFDDRSKPFFPELKASLEDFKLRLYDFVAASITLAGTMITALQLPSAGAEPRELVLAAIQDAMATHESLHLVDTEILQKCIELPREEIEMIVSQNRYRSYWELWRISLYPQWYSERNALLIEDYLILMRDWWAESAPEVLSHMYTLPEYGGIINSLIPLSEELIAEELLESISTEEGMAEFSRNKSGLASMVYHYMTTTRTYLSQASEASAVISSVTGSLLSSLQTNFCDISLSYMKVLNHMLQLEVTLCKLDFYMGWRISAPVFLKDLTRALLPFTDSMNALNSVLEAVNSEVQNLDMLVTKLDAEGVFHSCSRNPVGETTETPDISSDRSESKQKQLVVESISECASCFVDELKAHLGTIKRDIEMKSQSIHRLPQEQIDYDSSSRCLNLAQLIFLHSTSLLGTGFRSNLLSLRDSTSSLLSNLPEELAMEVKVEVDNLRRSLEELQGLGEEIRLEENHGAQIQKACTFPIIQVPWVDLIPEAPKGPFCVPCAGTVQPQWRPPSHKAQKGFSKQSKASKEEAKSRPSTKGRDPRQGSSTKITSNDPSFSGNWDF
ncbi:hypothetical protein NP233_g6151 [Leucocoprinus birnbaumii]|uniref:Uncharacterized protein n=1 Tax=Leucocoprinus birnbaumii TaxID=56174 RepID=A0AAD5VRH8_9AGAR|nr:hypothetical protein NP233_g6151 [Leucocoprinus birnbaumii]